MGIQEKPPVEMSEEALQHAFRDAMSKFASTICVLTCRDGDGAAHGMAATAVTALCIEPVSILACVGLGTTFFEGLQRSNGFCVNVLAESQAEQSRIFGSSRFRDERFVVGAWHDDPLTGAPVLGGAQANLICTPEAIHNYGSHAIIAGRALSITVGDAAGPLVYLDRHPVVTRRLPA